MRRAGTAATTRRALFLTAFIVVLSYFTHMHNYASPPYFFWDENYHLTSAQKYLGGIFFMEPHPPLGKMLIALGEYVVDANPEDNQMIDADYQRKLPPDFSFAGYRLFPAMLGWLTAPLVFWIFMLITQSGFAAAILSFLYIFDNAMIVHGRGAMLDSPMLFFCAAMALLFLLMVRWKEKAGKFYLCAALFGACLGLVLATKVLGLIMVLLIPALFVPLYPRWRRMAGLVCTVLATCLFVYVAVWQAHFARAERVNPTLAYDGYYQASEEYKEILASGGNRSLRSFPIMWRDSMRYVSHYTRGVPVLDLCKPDENGSPFFLWPIGARTINYRWSTADSMRHSYLYLVPNPVGWAAGLLGVFSAASLLLASAVLPLRRKLNNPYLLFVFLGLYVSYMVAVAQLGRVMYLYHYFLPLLFSFILFGLAYMEVQNVGKWPVTERGRMASLIVFGFLLFLSHQFYRPFTYGLPISQEQFERRNLLTIWNMRCIGCERENTMVIPRTCRP